VTTRGVPVTASGLGGRWEPPLAGAGARAARSRAAAETVLVGALWLCAAWTLISTLQAVWASRFPLPFGDQWDFLEPPASLGDWFAQHNEHRIAVPRIVFALDRILVRGDNRVLLATALLVQLAHVVLLWRVLGQSPGVRRRTKAILAGLTLASLFSLLQWENLLWGFQISFVGVFFLATVACFTLARGAERERVGAGSAGPWVLATCGLASIAAYTLANGLLVGFLVAALAYWLRLPRRWLCVLGGTALALAVAYLWDFQLVRDHSDPREAMLAPGAVAMYTAAYLGAPVGRVVGRSLGAFGLAGEALRVPVAVGAGAVGLSALAAVLSVLRADPARVVRGTEIVLPCMVAFVAASALVTALGRHGFPVEQALSSRYATGALLYWVCLGSLVWLLGERRGAAWWDGLRWIALAAAVAIAAGLAGLQFAVAEELRNRFLWLQEAKLAVVSDIPDDKALRRLYPEPRTVRERVVQLRAQRQAVFAKAWPFWLGTPLRTQLQLEAPERCLGHFDRADPVSGPEGGARVAGWAWDVNASRVPARIVLVDAQGMVAGFAEPGYRRLDVPHVHRAVGSRAGWFGYVRSTGRDPVTAYAITSDGRGACPLRGARPVRATVGTR
jgi:hypothetical protein